MPGCQVLGCTNISGKGKSLFSIPDPTRSLDHKRLCQKWLKNIGNPHLDIKTFKAHPSKKVCEDHCRRDVFIGPYENTVAKSLKFDGKRKCLKKDAVPTLFRVPTVDNDDNIHRRLSAESIAEKKLKARLKKEIRELKAAVTVQSVPESVESDHCTSETSPPVLAMEIDDIVDVQCVTATCVPVTPIIQPEFQQDVQCAMETCVPVTPIIQSEFQQDVQCVMETCVPLTSIIQPELDQSDVLVATKIVQEPETLLYTREDGGYSDNSCGHPCVLCHHNHVQVTSSRGDHTYAAPVSYVSVGTQTDPVVTENTDEANKAPGQSNEIITNSEKCQAFSTPTKTVLGFPAKNMKNVSVENLRDISKATSFRDDLCDITFTSELIESDSESEAEFCEEIGCSVVNDRKFVVFESAIDKLIKFVSCPICRSPVCNEDIVKDTTEGSLLKCDLYCIQGHHILKWYSQPMLGKMPDGNLLLSASLLFSGLSFSRVQQMASFLGLQMFSHTTFTSIQRKQLMPVVLHSWEVMQGEILDRVKATGRPLKLAGDGRCDSPGFSAKYCTYSLMELESNRIVTFVVVSVADTGSSSKMEVEGFRRCLELLLDKGFRIEVLATDRHVQIRSLLKKEKQFDGINHQFDVWHLAKSVKKKLTAKAKVKGSEELHAWIKAITNHLWWCASNCNGDADWLEECWISVVSHTVNVHEFDGDLIQSCPHTPLEPEIAKKKKWLKPGSRAHNGLKEVVLDKRLRKDIRQLSAFCHTGNLEVYHSLMTKYIPKRQEFDYDQMVTRTALVAMDHNMSQNREQKSNKKGEKMFKAVCPKATGQWVVKKVYEEKDYKWVEELLEMVVDQKKCKFLPPTTVKKTKNIAPRPAPKKADLITNLKSRFLKC